MRGVTAARSENVVQTLVAVIVLLLTAAHLVPSPTALKARGYRWAAQRSKSFAEPAVVDCAGAGDVAVPRIPALESGLERASYLPMSFECQASASAAQHIGVAGSETSRNVAQAADGGVRSWLTAQGRASGVEAVLRCVPRQTPVCFAQSHRGLANRPKCHCLRTSETKAKVVVCVYV